MMTFEEYLKEEIEPNYNVHIINGYHILKKDDKYFGVVSENALVESDIGFDTLSDLVNYLYKE